MVGHARWNVRVSRGTDIALRALLATRGGRKGDLSRFAEEAVNREVLRETIRDIQARNADASAVEIDRLIDDELGEAGGPVRPSPLIRAGHSRQWSIRTSFARVTRGNLQDHWPARYFQKNLESRLGNPPAASLWEMDERV